MAQHWICMSWDDSGRFISCYFLNSEQNLTGSRFWKAFVWAISLHHFERDGVSAICLSSNAFMKRKKISLSSLSLSPAKYVNTRVNSKAHGHWENRIFTQSSFPWKIFFYFFPGFLWHGKKIAESLGGTLDSEIIALFFSLANDIKVQTRVVVLIIFEPHTPLRIRRELCVLSLKKTRYVNMREVLLANIGGSWWWITHPWLSQGSMNPSLNISDLNNQHLHGSLVYKVFSNLSFIWQLSKLVTHFTFIQKKKCVVNPAHKKCILTCCSQILIFIHLDVKLHFENLDSICYICKTNLLLLISLYCLFVLLLMWKDHRLHSKGWAGIWMLPSPNIYREGPEDFMSHTRILLLVPGGHVSILEHISVDLLFP